MTEQKDKEDSWLALSCLGWRHSCCIGLSDGLSISFYLMCFFFLKIYLVYFIHSMIQIIKCFTVLNLGKGSFILIVFWWFLMVIHVRRITYIKKLESCNLWYQHDSRVFSKLISRSNWLIITFWLIYVFGEHHKRLLAKFLKSRNTFGLPCVLHENTFFIYSVKAIPVMLTEKVTWDGYFHIYL